MNILIVDDDRNSRKAVAHFLQQIGHETTECNNAEEAILAYSAKEYPMVLSDIKMPGASGVELLKVLLSMSWKCPSDIVLFTGYGDVELAVESLHLGAFDYLLKPVNAEKLAETVERIERHQEQLRSRMGPQAPTDASVPDEAAVPVSLRYDLDGMDIGVFSEASRQNVAMALRYHEDPAIPVLIEGETGTGKEIIARLVHNGGSSSGNNGKPFIDINCATISHSLFESELFGYEGNSFTGSSKTQKPGKLDAADGGTLFLDELEALPLDLQGKLLRVLQEREFYRVGGVQKIRVDIRIVCATNIELAAKVAEGSFRRDLYYRMKVGHIKLKPLRERREEILPLAGAFLAYFSKKKRKHFKYISDSAGRTLKHYNWNGNIRELRNTIEWAVFMYDDSELKAEHLEPLIAGPQPPVDKEDPTNTLLVNLNEDGVSMESVKRQLIEKVLAMHEGNKSATARYLGISRRSLVDIVQKWGESE